MNKLKPSHYCFIACTALMLTLWLMFTPKHSKPGERTLFMSDVGTYYWYLPSVFIYKDLKHQQFGDSIVKKYRLTDDFCQSFVYKNGNRVMGYSSGQAVMFLPFFIMAHLVAAPLGYPADGFSEPYQFSIAFGCLLIALIGVWYFRKLLLFYFGDRVVAIMLLILVFGTNYLEYTTVAGALTHNWLFTVYVFLLLNTHYFYKRPSLRYAVRIGLLIGLAILTRPSEIIAILIPLLWGMENLSISAIKQRLNFLWLHKNTLMAAAVSVIAVGSVQIAYWMYVAGKPFVYSYRDQGFSWLHPHFWNYIFSYRSGWFTYTPMVILMFISVIFFLKTGKNKVAILVFFALNLYIVSAWDIWWYGGTGGRAMVQSYPVILFPLAAFIDWMLKQKIRIWAVTPVLLFFVYFNLWFTWNSCAEGGLFDPEGMSRSYFWAVAGRWKVPDDTEKLKDTEELFKGKPKQMRLLYENRFEDDSLFNPEIPAVEGKRSLYIKAHTTSPHYVATFTPGQSAWVRVQATFHCLQKQWTGWKMLQLVVRLQNNDNIVKERMIRVDRYLNSGDVKDIFIDVKIPKEPINRIEVFFWNDVNDNAMVVDDLKFYSFHD
jgi:hypothetical protein